MKPLAVVGLGASAGGLSALRGFLSDVPPDTGLTYVVVVHLSPEHESHLADLLQPTSSVPVTQVIHAERLEPNHVYVIPPGRNLSAIDTHLRLTEIEESRRERAPIDHFFRTLSETHDGHAVGVILSGTGSDGTLGLRCIRERAGLTIVQEPTEAEHDGMPRSAIHMGVVDLILPVGQMLRHILAFTTAQPLVQVSDDDERVADELAPLRKILVQLRGARGTTSRATRPRPCCAGSVVVCRSRMSRICPHTSSTCARGEPRPTL